MVVGLLGILKAGGAYVPLDSAYPSQRLKQILADADPAILLSDSSGLGALGWDILSELMVVDLETSGQPEALAAGVGRAACSEPGCAGYRG